MFYCNGWMFIWGMVVIVGMNVIICNVEVKVIYDFIVKYKVMYFCGVLVVFNIIVNVFL